MNSRHHALIISLLLVGLVGGAVVGVGPAAAQEDTEPNPFEDLTNSSETTADEPQSVVDRIVGGFGTGWEYASIALAGVEGSAERYVPGNPFAEDPTAADHAQDFRAATNANSETLSEGFNQHTTPSTSWNTTRVVFLSEDENSPDVAVYVLTDLDSNGQITDVRAVNATNRSVDHTIVMEEKAAADADKMVATLSDGFRQGNQPVDTVATSKWAGKYCSKSGALLGSGSKSCDVTSTYWMDQSELPDYNLEE